MLYTHKNVTISQLSSATEIGRVITDDDHHHMMINAVAQLVPKRKCSKEDNKYD